MTRTLDLDHISLGAGCHQPPDPTPVDGGLCVMEAVAWVAGEPWSDHPKCASPVVGAFLRSWNDTLNDDDRQNLKQYIPRLVGSAGTPELEERRAWMALDWLVRTYTPAWLRLAGLTGQADTLAGLPEFRKGMDVPSIRSTIEAVRADARAAGAAAWAAAGAAAWDAARAAARDAARDAAWAAAGAAAGDAAWDAARDAARDAAGAAARDAARDAARAAARDAARAAVRPTVVELQQSAHGLVDRMLDAEEAR